MSKAMLVCWSQARCINRMSIIERSELAATLAWQLWIPYLSGVPEELPITSGQEKVLSLMVFPQLTGHSLCCQGHHSSSQRVVRQLTLLGVLASVCFQKVATNQAQSERHDKHPQATPKPQKNPLQAATYPRDIVARPLHIGWPQVTQDCCM